MKGQFNSVFEFNVELELIEVNGDGVRSGIFRHFSTPEISLKKQGILPRPESMKKMLRHIPSLPLQTIAHAKNNVNLKMDLSKSTKEVMSCALIELGIGRCSAKGAQERILKRP